MTSAEGAKDGSPIDGRGDEQLSVRSRRLPPTRVRIAIVAVLLALSVIVARTCQQAQIRVTQEQAVATAKDQIDFTPTATQVRLLRQGIGRQPFWIVSLSIPNPDSEGTFRHLALVRVDANTGEVASVQQDTARAQQEP